jgi:hypothetical protein
VDENGDIQTYVSYYRFYTHTHRLFHTTHVDFSAQYHHAIPRYHPLLYTDVLHTTSTSFYYRDIRKACVSHVCQESSHLEMGSEYATPPSLTSEVRVSAQSPLQVRCRSSCPLLFFHTNESPLCGRGHRAFGRLQDTTPESLHEVCT